MPAGKPIRITQPDFEPLYVLDSTHPGAQEYLRQTYRTLTQGVGRPIYQARLHG